MQRAEVNCGLAFPEAHGVQPCLFIPHTGNLGHVWKVSNARLEQNSEFAGNARPGRFDCRHPPPNASKRRALGVHFPAVFTAPGGLRAPGHGFPPWLSGGGAVAPAALAAQGSHRRRRTIGGDRARASLAVGQGWRAVVLAVIKAHHQRQRLAMAVSAAR